jgi:hypothetical protein
MKRIVIGAAAVVMFGVIAFVVLGHRVPSSQRELTPLDQNSINVLTADFNAARDATRLVLLLSPT